MKILHTADLHLGAPLRAHLPPREAKLRRDELLSTLHRILQFSRTEQCDAVILAGDLFDSEAAAAMLAPTVLREIEKYSEIDFYYASGNHEGRQWLPQHLPENLHVFDEEFSYFKKKNIVFCGKSSPKSSDFENFRLQNNAFNILVLHGAWEDGASKNAEIPLGLLRGKGIDYCALGHYHSYSERRIDARGVAVYCGCPEGRGFDETGQKGVVLIETKNGYLTYRFVALAGRIFHKLSADISSAKSVLDVVSLCETVATAARSNDFVRLTLTGNRTECPAPDTEAIERHLQGRFYYLEVHDASVDAPDLSAISAEPTLRGEFVRTVQADLTLSQEEKMRILSLGLTALHKDVKGGAAWS